MLSAVGGVETERAQPELHVVPEQLLALQRGMRVRAGSAMSQMSCWVVSCGSGRHPNSADTVG